LTITQVGSQGCSIGVEVEVELCSQFARGLSNDWWDVGVWKTCNDVVSQGCRSCCCWMGAFERLGAVRCLRSCFVGRTNED